MVYEEANLPIDIHTSKLVDWLVSRRHVKKNWSDSVQIVRAKINDAIQDMPEHEGIVKLLSGSYINYFHCLQIIEILRETEKESKNIFGWYSSQRMKDWEEVIRLYKTDNIYLAEASQYFVRNVNHEIPSLKKQISKCQQMHEDCDKREQEYLKASSLAKDRFASACKKIGIGKENLKEEIMGLLKKLPEKFIDIADQLKGLEDARSFYQDYIQFIFDSERYTLPLLAFIIERGNVTLYEWNHGEPPINIKETELIFPSDKEDTQSSEIDFDVGDSCGDAIVYDDADLETGEIDWGDSCDVEGAAVIDYGIEVDGTEESNEIVIESSGMDGGVAAGQEALSLLFNEGTRNQLLNEIMELEGFLSQRMNELNENENILSLNLFSNSPKSLQYQNVKTISEYLVTISNIIHELTSEKMQHLYMISSSPRYVSRLVDSLHGHIRDSGRALASIETTNQKRTEAVKQQQTLTQHLHLIVTRTRILKQNIQNGISKKYNNRPVNLMGGIQNI